MSASDSPRDLWESGTAYERFMGRWSRELGRVFVGSLRVPSGRHWLEVGCGTGALTSGVLQVGNPASLIATDASPQFIAHASDTLQDRRVQFLTASADDLPTRSEGYDGIVSSLVLNFIPDPTGALRAMRELATDKGLVASCVWDYAGGMEFLRRFWDAAVELDPTARQYDEGERFPICSSSGLEEAFEHAGFSDVRVEALEVPTVFQDFDDYWSPFVGGPGPAPGYLSSLSVQKQQQLADHLAASLPRSESGTIALTAKAWAARAEV